MMSLKRFEKSRPQRKERQRMRLPEPALGYFQASFRKDSLNIAYWINILTKPT